MKKLILIHGAIGGADQLIPLKELLKNDFEVHMLEFEGHGKHSSILEPYSLENFDHQLTEALNKVGEPAHIFGYSMGGFVALLNAAEGNRNVLSVTTLGTKLKWSEDIAEKESKHLNPRVIREKVPKFAEALEKRHGEHWEDVLKRTADFMHDLGELKPIQKDLMSQMKVPVQLCLADQDNMVSVEETHQVHEWIANSKLEIIPESKHPIEQVDLMILANAIKSFVQSV